MVDLAAVGIAMDTSQVKSGEQVVVRSFANIADAQSKMNRFIEERERLERRAAEATKLRIETEQRAASGERVRAAFFRETVELEKRAIAELAAARRAAWAEGGPLFRAEAAAYAENASRAKVAAAAKREADQASRRLSGALSVLSTAAIGVPGPVGRVVSSLGALAIGSATTVGVLAGVAAISAAYTKLTEDSRKAREETDKLRGALQKAAEAYRAQDEPLTVFGEKMATLGKEAARFQRELTEELARGPARYGSSGLLIPGTGVDEAKVARLRGELRALGTEALTAQRQALAQVEANREAIETANTGTMQSFGDLADFQRLVAGEIAAAQGDAATLIQLEYETKLAKVEEAFAKLSAAGQRDARALKDQLVAVLDLERILALTGTDGYTARVTGRPPGTTLQPRGITTEFGAPVPPFTPEEERAWEQRYEAVLRTATDAFQRGFEEVFANGLAGFDDFFDALEKLAVQAASSIAAAMAIEALGIDQLLKNLTGPNGADFWSFGEGFKGRGATAVNAVGGFAAGSFFGSATNDPFGGLIGGAAGGAAVGGPVGAIVGGVSGLVTGLLGSSAQAAAAARRMEEARIAFGRALDDFVAAAAGGRGGLEQARLDVRRQADDLRRSVGDQYGPFNLPGRQDKLDQITKAEEEYLAFLEEEAALKRQQIGEDLDVRALRAQGRDEEADALALSIAQSRERLEIEALLKDQVDKSLLAQVDYVHGLEREAEAKRKAEEAARKETERLERQARVNEDLEVRLLRAEGKDDLADAMQRRINFEREYAQAMKDGLDEATLAMIEHVYAQEELAIATAKAADEAQKLIDAINAEARATENLTVRHLRATGAVFAADEAAQLFQQQEERRRAIEEGRSQEFIAYLDQVHAEERAFADNQRRQAQQDAFDAAVRSAFPADATFLPDSRTSVNLAVGVSESTAGQMTGLMRSQLTYLATLPDIRTILARIDARFATIETALGGRSLVQVFDEELGLEASGANAAAGVPPGNR